MKRRFSVGIALAVSAVFAAAVLSCATTGRGRNALSLEDAIRQSAGNLQGNLPAGTRVAIVAFDSETNNLSDFIMGELTGALRGFGIEVAERRNLGVVLNELNLSLDGSVSDETALSVGRMQAAEVVITGQLWDLGAVRRLEVNAIHAETAVGTEVPRVDVRNDRELQNMVDAINRRDPALLRAASQPDEHLAAQSAGAYLDRGMLFFDRSDYEIAIMDFSEAIRLNPNLATAFFWRANAFKRLFDLDRALADLTQAIRLNPNNSAAYNNRGLIHSQKGDLDRAMADYNQAIRLAPDNAAAYSNRGLAHLNRGDLDRAMADFNQSIRLKPFSATAHHNRANVHLQRGEIERAIADLSMAIRLDPFDDMAYFDRAMAHLEIMEDFDRAIADFSRVIRLAPHDIDAFIRRGDAHLERAFMHFSRGDGRLELAEVNRAIADFQAALRLDPNDPRALEWLELALRIRG